MQPATRLTQQTAVPMPRVAVALACACLMSMGSQAQTMVNTTTTPAAPFQDFQRPPLAAPLPRPTPGVAPSPRAEPPAAAPTLRFVLRGVQLRGSTRLSSHAVSALTQPYLRREVDFAALQELSAAIGTLYRAEGWVVRVSLPAQDLTDGVVTFDVVEARFGGATIELDSEARFSLDRAAAFVSAALPKGEAVNASQLDRAILLLDDLPGIAATGNLAPGAVPGESVLQLSLSPEPSATGQLSVDNHGSKATGALRVSGNLALNSPFGIGDQVTLAAVRSEGSALARVSWTLPVGGDGLRVGVNASDLNYRLTAPSFTALAAKGRFDSWGVDMSYPLVRSMRQNLSAQFSWEEKRFVNEASGSVVSNYRVTNAVLGLSGSSLDEWAGGGVSTASLQYTSGRTLLDGSPNQAADATSARTAGGFAKWRYSLTRQQSVGGSTSLVLGLSGQVASKNLDSSERFFLGGATGLRAYPVGEAGGSEGQMFNIELRQSLGSGVTLTGFYDRGRVRVNRNNNFAGAATINDYLLSGAGASLVWALSSGTSLSATWARRIANNPLAGATGNDQDGTRVINRFWFTASQRF